ncbi:MAG: inhibitor of cysteine peptidase [Methanolobus sp.]|nr:inhibitor of cysteine peptidase [Methanolobus sp.]MDN5310333.1 inhibitor of cysteine peptidase [Methanolobus sp.]
MKNSGNTMLGIMVLIVIVIVAVTTLTLGCFESGNNTTTNDTVNDSGDEGYLYGTAAVEEIDIRILESFPVQVHVAAKGNLPDGCTQINENATTVQRQGNTFNVYLETIRLRDAMCTEALVPFEHTIPLDVYGLERGTYTVNVNGVEETFELTTDNILAE